VLNILDSWIKRRIADPRSGNFGNLDKVTIRRD
jgi:hypothetical protein